MTPILGMVMNMLQSKNPQMFQNVNQAMQNGQNPNELLRQVMGNMNDKQKEGLIKQAGNMGCPKEILAQIQNMK